MIASDVYSRILDFTDRRTAVLFGDGAGAAVVGTVPEPYGILDVELVTRGDAAELIRVEAGGSRLPASAETVATVGITSGWTAGACATSSPSHVPPALTDLLDRAGLHAKDVDHFVPHQANGVMLQDLVRGHGLDGAHTHLTLERYGNVGSASVPVALDDAAASGALRDGDLVLLAGFGGGMSVGAAMLRWYDPPRHFGWMSQSQARRSSAARRLVGRPPAPPGRRSARAARRPAPPRSRRARRCRRPERWRRTGARRRS